MEGLIKKALGSGQADYIEIRLEEKAVTSVVYSGKELDSAGANTTKGGNVRALYKGGWGFVSFSSLDQLEAKVAQACKAAKLVGKGKSVLAKVPKVTADIKVSLKDDPRKVSLEQKVELAKKYNGLIIGSKGIISSGGNTRKNNRKTYTGYGNKKWNCRSGISNGIWVWPPFYCGASRALGPRCHCSVVALISPG